MLLKPLREEGPKFLPGLDIFRPWLSSDRLDQIVQVFQHRALPVGFQLQKMSLFLSR